MLLSFYFKSWPSVKKKERKKIEWLLISFVASDRRPSLREEKQCHYATIEEKCQREKNKYDFFFFFFPFFFDQYERKTTISRHERTYLTNHRVCFSILFHVPLGQMATDTRPTLLNTINRSFTSTGHTCSIEGKMKMYYATFHI